MVDQRQRIMKRWTNLSLALNPLLLGFVVWLACAGRRFEMSADFSRSLTHRGLRAKPQSTPPSLTREPLVEVVVMSEPFDWAQLESADYHDYLANLRAIGCPEPTVGDIIIADVNDLFTLRVKALVDEVSGRFWELILRPDDFEKMVEEKHAQLRALENERDELFAEVFGESDPRSAENLLRSAADRRAEWERIGDFLSEEKCARFVFAKEALERDWTDFLRIPGPTGEQQQAKRKELEAALDQTLRAAFTADEYNEVRLRQSPVASLRYRLVGLALDEEMVRAVANLQFENMEAQAAFSPKDADFKSRAAQLQQQSKAQTRELIGPDGYAAFQRATDGCYELIYRVTQRLELPDTAAAQTYDIRRQAEEAAHGVQADNSLAAEARQAQLQAIGAETRKSLSAALGTKGLAAYENLDGGWMQQFTAVH